MATLTLTGDEELDRMLQETEARMNTLSVPFQQASLIVFASVKRNFSSGGRPAWKPLKVRKGEPLRDTGRLMASIGNVLDVSRSGTRQIMEIGTNVVYANVHQFGFSGSVTQNVRAHKRVITQAFGRSISPTEVNVKAHSRTIEQNIPARPFLMLQPTDEQDIGRVFQEYINFE